jgi:hypothetical protein
MGACRRQLLVALALSLVLIVPGAPAVAAAGRAPAPAARAAPASLGDVCAGVTHVIPAGPGALQAQSYQFCIGTVYRQQMDNYLDVCVLEIIICWEWSGGKFLNRSSKVGPGAWSIPVLGYFRISGLKRGLRYRVRTFNWGWTYSSGLLHMVTAAENIAP